MSRPLRFILLMVGLLASQAVSPAHAGIAPPLDVHGVQKFLVVAVRFPGTDPAVSLDKIKQKADFVDRYIRSSSYGKVQLAPQVAGWYEMPDPLSDYQISPHNYDVDRNRVRKLVADALGAARLDGIDPSAFDQVWIVVGAATRPGQGYGMVAYCANPGMLSGVSSGTVRNVRVNLTGGGFYAGPVIVSAENAHVGHAAHDLLHALGGSQGGFRTIPDLYDFDLQSNPPSGTAMSPALFALHAGPWGIMSQHFIDPQSPPPPPLAFTRIQLGWISADQVVDMTVGEERELTLAPLAGGQGTLAVRIRMDSSQTLLVENRQPGGADRVLPSHGLVISRITPHTAEGHGIVKVMDANPSSADLSDAPFRIGAGELRAFVDHNLGVAVAPLSLDADGSMRIVVTTPKRFSAR